MSRRAICKVDDVVEGKLLPVRIGRATAVVCRLPSGDIKVVSGRCPHQGADFTYASITGCTTGNDPYNVAVERTGEILRCPWHGFEFDLMTGCPLVGAAGMRLREYRATIDGDEVIIEP